MNKNEIKRNPRGAGRKKKYTDEELLEIIDSFLINEYKGDINSSLIARYASEKLNYNGIKYYHFSKNQIVNDKIEDIKKERKREFVSDFLQSFQNINTDIFVDKYINNPLKLKKFIRDVQLAELEMYDRMSKIETKNRELQESLNESTKNCKELNMKNKDLLKGIKEIGDNLNIVRKLINVENHLKILKYVYDNTSIECRDLVDQYLLILRKCGIIIEDDSEKVKSQKNTTNLSDQQRDIDFIINKFKKNVTDGMEIDKENENFKNSNNELDEVSLEELDRLLDD